MNSKQTDAPKDILPRQQEQLKPDWSAKKTGILLPIAVFCGFFVCTVVGLLIHYPLQNIWTEDSVDAYLQQVYLPDGKIDLNRADAAALCSLPGIGQTKAQAILDWREQNDGFQSVAQLLRVEGISERLYQEILPYLDIPTEE